VERALPPEYHIASLVGRAIAMDRAEQWDRTVTTARLLTTATGTSTIDPVEYLQAQYAENIGDEFIPGVHCTDDVIRAGDAVLFFNFRADRMRQLGKLFLGLAPHTIANTVTIPDDLLLASMTSYDDAFTRMPVIFPKTTTKNNLGEWVSVQGGHQLRLSETEKYAHVTYFINGGEEIKYPNEERLMVPSLGLKNYAEHPEMSLPELSNTLVHALDQQHADLIICNIANGDMVGHSGDLAAAKRAVVHVDEALSCIIPSANANGYTTLVTADHGNIESMVEDNAPHTAHTFNHVPCLVTRPGITLRNGHLHEVAPTILALMGLPQPPEMTSQSLIVL
jgi:2,3-bisphosphoglycerate-independent phosphoglycerate mutase